jgi:hypothetical protein
MAGQLTIIDLHDELQIALLSAISTSDLRRAARVCKRWREHVALAAESRLRLHCPALPSGSAACPCWLRSLFTQELIETTVGPKPRHSWREEHVELHVAAEQMRWEKESEMPWDAVVSSVREDYSIGGSLSLEKTVEMHRSQLTMLRQAGWSEDDSVLTLHIAGEETNQVAVSMGHFCAVVFLCTNCDAPHTMNSFLDSALINSFLIWQVLMNSFLERRDAFVATLHSTAAAYTAAAMRATPAPTCYCTVLGLADWSPEWLSLPQRQVGESFFCVSGASAREPMECYFSARGMHTESTVLRPGASGLEVSRDRQWKAHACIRIACG